MNSSLHSPLLNAPLGPLRALVSYKMIRLRVLMLIWDSKGPVRQLENHHRIVLYILARALNPNVAY